MTLRTATLRTLLSLLLTCLPTLAAPPTILKIDPPNWWAAMPKPMLLIQGEHLTGATVHLSDRRLGPEIVTVSPNGHWAQVWLRASPTTAKTITLTIQTPSGTTSAPYAFNQKRGPREGPQGFSSRDVMYLIMTDRFADGDLSNDGTPSEHAAERSKPRGWHGGDFLGIEQHLDYLQQLGITTVWITPVYANQNEPDSYHGYGATDLYAVDPHFGSLKDLQHLSAALHARGMKFVLDIVPNHVGPSIKWVYDSPTTGWFHGTVANHVEAQGEFKPLTDPHAPWRDQQRVTEGWFANILPDLNQESPAVSKYLIQNTIWWTETAGFDGLRIDTFPYVGRPFWHAFHAELHSLFPRLTTVGEIFNGDPTITSAFAGGVTRNARFLGVDTGLDTPFDFPTYFALRHVFLQNSPMSELADMLRHDDLYPHPERLVSFLGNHDTPRFLSEPGATPEKLKLAFAVLLTMRGMPQIYSGDEIAMLGGEDPDNRRDFPGGFSPSSTSPDAFDPSRRSPSESMMYTWVHQLLELRHAEPALQTGDEQILEAAQDTLVTLRGQRLEHGCTHGEPTRILLAVNRSSETRTLTIRTGQTGLESCQLTPVTPFNTSPPSAINSATVTLTLPSSTASFYRALPAGYP